MRCLSDAFLDREIFHTLEEARALAEQWQQTYNHIRPHSALGYRPPAPEAILAGGPTLALAAMAQAGSPARLALSVAQKMGQDHDMLNGHVARMRVVH